CSSCHFPGAGLNGSSGLFTDFSYEAIGVPRNPDIPANRDTEYFDIGVCGPLRTDHRPGDEAANKFCGLFKTPTLRNLPARRVFFHNGAMHSLEQVIRFYNTRDTMPELWYPKRGGKVRKYDDLPAGYRANIDPQLPLDGRKAGSKPPMTERQMQDLICFLKTLDDDYHPPAAAPQSGPCVD